MIADGVKLVWESDKLDPYVKKFSETVTKFQEQVEELVQLQQSIDGQLTSLDTCAYAAPAFEQALASLQKAVDSLSLGHYSNLSKWVQQLDLKVGETLSVVGLNLNLPTLGPCLVFQIEQKLVYRLQEAIRAWTKALQGKDEEEDLNSTQHDSPQQKAGGEPKVAQMVHEMRLTSQVLYLSPSVEEARQSILGKLFSWEAIVTS